MAAIKQKTPLQPDLTSEPTDTPIPKIDTSEIENLLADSLLDSIDWQKVKTLMLQKAKAKFWTWISAAAPASDASLALLPDAIAIGASEVSND
jgi:hypothetical protein